PIYRPTAAARPPFDEVVGKNCGTLRQSFGQQSKGRGVFAATGYGSQKGRVHLLSSEGGTRRRCCDLAADCGRVGVASSTWLCPPPNFYPSLIIVRDQERSTPAQKDVSHGPEPGKSHSRTRLRDLGRAWLCPR